MNPRDLTGFFAGVWQARSILLFAEGMRLAAALRSSGGTS